MAATQQLSGANGIYYPIPFVEQLVEDDSMMKDANTATETSNDSPSNRKEKMRTTADQVYNHQISWKFHNSDTPTQENELLKKTTVDLERRNAQLEQRVQELQAKLRSICPCCASAFEEPPPTSRKRAVTVSVCTNIRSSTKTVSTDESHFNFASQLVTYQNYAEALKHLNAATALNFNHCQAHALKAETLRLLNRLPESLGPADQALAIQPGNLLALVNKGAALRYLGYIHDSLAVYEQALQIEPLDRFALEGKIENLFILGDFNKCSEAIQFTLDQYPNNPTAFKFMQMIQPKGLETSQVTNPVF